mmetsp:Transcript_9748/g.18315  ORF Transcript_9748/g.18315 Transcript_9748/m.18315 type:complete len:349 (+) Transcript_9748:570-1616(+)
MRLSIHQHLKDLTILLQPDNQAIEELHHKVDYCPLQTALDTTVNKHFILSEYNRDGQSYRSPWSNEYIPTPATASDASSSASTSDYNHNQNNVERGGLFFKPSGELRQLEEQANEVFGSYREMYYGKESVGSVYLWNRGGGILQEGGFAGCFLIQKQIDEKREEVVPDSDLKSHQKGYWNSIHVVDVNVLSGGDRVKYELSTTVLLSMDLVVIGSYGGGKFPMVTEIGGSLSKQKEKICPFPPPSMTGGTRNGGLEHIANIGQMIEAVEIEIRSNIDTLSIQKTKEILLQGIRKDSSGDSWSRDGGSGGGGGSRRSGMGIASLLQSSAASNPMQAELMARLRQRSTQL